MRRCVARRWHSGSMPGRRRRCSTCWCAPAGYARSQRRCQHQGGPRVGGRSTHGFSMSLSKQRKLRKWGNSKSGPQFAQFLQFPLWGRLSKRAMKHQTA